MDPGSRVFNLPPHRIVQAGEMGLITDFVDRQIVRHGKEPCYWIIKRSLVAQMPEQTQEGFLS